MAEPAISPVMWRIERPLAQEEHEHTLSLAYADDLIVI